MHVDFPSKVLWRSCALQKWGFFTWESTWSRISTLDIIQKRGRAVANRCYLFRKEEKSCNHILLHCIDEGCLASLVYSI